MEKFLELDTLTIFSNLIPALIILFFVYDGWKKGALFMLINLLKLIVAYFVARILSEYLTNYLMTLPVVRSQITNVALNYSDSLNGMFGALLLLTGNTLQNTLQNIAWWLIYGISYTVIFTMILILISIIQKIALKANKIPVLGTANRLLGAIEGLLFGTGFTLVAIYIVIFILNLTDYKELSQVLNTSWLPEIFSRLIS